MKYKGLQFRNEGEKTVEIDVEGVIGGSFWWDDNPESKNTKEKMKAELKRLSAIKAETIIVNINSYGGDVNHGLSIYDLLAENSAKIITKINGMTASIATVIAMAGDERKISDNSLFLAHLSSTFAIGNINDFNVVADDLKKIDDRILNVYIKVTGKDEETIREIMNRNNGYGEWITPDEAKKIGFITDIFEPRKIAAFFSNDILKQYHLPDIPENYKKNIEQKENSDIGSQVINALKSFFTNTETNKNKSIMQKFKNICKILKVEDLESSDDKITLDENQLKLIDDKLAELETAQKTAEDSLNEATNELDSIDDTIKDVKTIKEKVVAVKAKLAEKPAVTPSVIITKEDKIDSNNGVDQKTIDELPHNREADANL